jgi:hypothetical protein
MHDWMDWEPVRGKRFASLVPTPARVLVAAGAAAAVVAGLMPWAEGVAPGRTGFEPVAFSGLAGAGDGVMLIVVSIGAGVFTLHRSPAESRTRTVRLVPVVLVVLAVFTWLNGQRAAGNAVEEWVIRGGSGGPAPGLWLSGLGVAAMVLGTLWLLPGIVRWRRRADDPDQILEFSWAATAELVAGAVGVLVGGVVGISLGLALTGPTIVGTVFLGAVFCGLLGGYAGTKLVSLTVGRLEERARRARQASSPEPGTTSTPGRGASGR